MFVSIFICLNSDFSKYHPYIYIYHVTGSSTGTRNSYNNKANSWLLTKNTFITEPSLKMLRFGSNLIVDSIKV